MVITINAFTCTSVTWEKTSWLDFALQLSMALELFACHFVGLIGNQSETGFYPWDDGSGLNTQSRNQETVNWGILFNIHWSNRRVVGDYSKKSKFDLDSTNPASVSVHPKTPFPKVCIWDKPLSLRNRKMLGGVFWKKPGYCSMWTPYYYIQIFDSGWERF